MKRWQDLLRESFTKISEVAEFLELDRENLDQLWDQPPFAFLLPRRLALKMPKNRLDDPLARQFLPLKEEGRSVLGFGSDPVGDVAAQKCPMLLHKYETRALIIASGACAMHCRYCFRQNFSYETSSDFSSEIAYLRKNPSLKEIILSGGDPLSLSERRLEDLMQDLFSISHLQIIRFHSRFVIGIPERINEHFLALLKRSPKQITFVIHINHARELDEEILGSLKKIASLGIPILSQTVLLKGVNDDFETLHTLFLTLITNGIIPYYLHQLDQTKGAHHFEVPEEKGLELMESLEKSLPGYAVPSYVREIAGKAQKTPIKDLA